jgi:hypothetical protein
MKGGVGCDASDETGVAGLAPRPCQAGLQAGERPFATLHLIGDDGKPERREALRLTVGTDDEVPHLRPQPRDHATDHRLAPKVDECFLAMVHAG